MKSSFLDVLLINPPWTKKGGNIWKGVASVMPPHGIAVIAAALEEAGCRVRILDTHAMKVAMEDLKGWLESYYPEPPGYIGLTGSTMTINHTYETAQICKQLYPQAKIVLGGAHASEKPQEAVSQHFVDFVIRGEGEFAFQELVRGSPLAGIRGLSYKEEGRIIHNQERELIK